MMLLSGVTCGVTVSSRTASLNWIVVAPKNNGPWPYVEKRHEGEGEAHAAGMKKYPLGTYSYPKWGSTCTVTVYPMAVTRVLSEETWQERHRGRRWVSPSAAAALLKQEALRPLVLLLEQRLS